MEPIWQMGTSFHRHLAGVGVSRISCTGPAARKCVIIDSGQYLRLINKVFKNQGWKGNDSVEGKFPEEIRWVGKRKGSVQLLVITKGTPSRHPGPLQGESYYKKREGKFIKHSNNLLSILCWLIIFPLWANVLAPKQAL